MHRVSEQTLYKHATKRKGWLEAAVLNNLQRLIELRFRGLLRVFLRFLEITVPAKWLQELLPEHLNATLIPLHYASCNASKTTRLFVFKHFVNERHFLVIEGVHVIWVDWSAEPT